MTLLSLHANETPPNQSACHADKNTTPFGQKLGGQGLLAGYSNGSNDCVSDEWHEIKLAHSKMLQTGMKWQCVEYARRWLNVQLSYTFGSIDHAYQIWNLKIATKIDDDNESDWLKFKNGQTKIKPKRHDLLIYDQKQGIHGHVSVVVDTQDDFVLIAEQNYSNEPWESINYARKVKLIKDKEGFYHIDDLGLMGWMRIKNV